MCGSKEECQEILERHAKQLETLQQLLYGSNKYALLLIFQGMDAAGKDGAIKHVMSGVNPQGCEGASFKQPSAQELDHDFLWRAQQKLPERGRIGIFNRSYYEEVLVVRVHPEILAGEGVADTPKDRKDVWEQRYRSILDMEKHLDRNGTRIVKFFLHLSKEEQRKRFLARIDEPEKNWKFSMADIHERKYWKEYATAFEEGLQATSTRHAPWYAVPADRNRRAGEELEVQHGGHPRAEVLEGVCDRVRGVSAGNQHASCAVVCGACGRQGERSADRVADCSGHAGSTEDVLSEDDGEAAPGAACDPQRAGEVITVVSGRSSVVRKGRRVASFR